MYKRLLILFAIWPVLIAPVLAGEYDAGTHLRLSGTLVSPNGRSALINNKVAREGDRIAGVQILAIEEGQIQIVIDSRRLTVRVGSTTAHAYSSNSIDVNQDYVKRIYGPVKRGETLSEIAAGQLNNDVSLNQVMIALFEANPDAFNNNINGLKEGASLRIPDLVSIQHLAAATATAEVQRQTATWQDDRYEVPVQHANVIKSMAYGPVSRGETLSGIAASLPRGGATIDQTIAALYGANPDAFTGNMNLLQEGAVLDIPATLRQQSPEMATAQIARHVNAWRREAPEPEQSIQMTHSDPPAIEIIASMMHNE